MLTSIFALALVCLVLERIIPGWRLPNVKTWPLRVVLVNIVQLGVVVLAGLTWEKWLGSISVVKLGEILNPWTGGAVAYFVATFVFYWWHRFRHTSDFLWLHFHQIHHSPQRLEVITSFYKHPLEMIVNSIIGSLLVYTLLGLGPEAGAIYTLFTAVGEFFYHTNVRTPRWVGYFFQRPEMHRIHHKYGYHRNNYGDIVWWDMLFGTYENPETFVGTCGFDPEKEEALGAMLRFKDVHRPQAKASAKTTAALLACALVASSSQPAEACTSFRIRAESGHVLMAKNYDWAIADGYVLALPRGQHRRAVRTDKNQNTMEWTSRYGSLAFTQFATGMTISGMNDQGLAIETLVNATGKLTTAQPANDALISLQWVQYQLDTASSVADVIASLEHVAPIQYLLPVHFLACDRSGDCAVIEGDAEGRAVVTNRSSNAAKAIVLANRDWLRDVKDAKLSRSWLPSLSLEKSSVARFRKASELLARHRPNGITDAFEVLDDVRMPYINRWQIVWDITAGKAYWVNREGTSTKADYASFDLKNLPTVCDPKRVLAARLGEKAPVASPMGMMPRSRVDSHLSELFDQSLALVGHRTGQTVSKELKAEAMASAKGALCP